MWLKRLWSECLCPHHHIWENEALTPKVMVFGGVAFLRSLSLDEVTKGAFLQEGKTKTPFSLSTSIHLGKARGGPSRKASIYKPERESSPGTHLHFDLGLSSSRTVSNRFLLIKPSVRGTLL